MEKYIRIPTSDNFEIKWIWNSKEKSDTLIIFVHGFTWSMWESHYYNAKEYFTEKWYDVFRFNLYTDWKITRKLRNCSVKVHSQDIREVANYFTEYKNILFVGHSLAWPCLSWVDIYPENIKKIIFWDPAFEMKTTWDKCYKEWDIVRHTSSWKHIEISAEMYREFLEENFLKILQNQDFPKSNMYVIYADGDRHVNNKITTDDMWIESHIIEWANHGFKQEGKYEELFEQTLQYIEK